MKKILLISLSVLAGLSLLFGGIVLYTKNEIKKQQDEIFGVYRDRGIRTVETSPTYSGLSTLSGGFLSTASSTVNAQLNISGPLSVSSTATFRPGPVLITDGTNNTTLSSGTSTFSFSGFKFSTSTTDRCGFYSGVLGKTIYLQGCDNETTGAGWPIIMQLSDGAGSSNDGGFSVLNAGGVTKFNINPQNGGNTTITVGSSVGDDLMVNASYAYANNRASISHPISITGSDATNHSHNWTLDANNALSCNATGNGAGGIGAMICYAGYESASLNNKFGINTPTPSSTLHVINYALSTTTVWIGDLSGNPGQFCLGEKTRGKGSCFYANNSTLVGFSTTTY